MYNEKEDSLDPSNKFKTYIQTMNSLFVKYDKKKIKTKKITCDVRLKLHVLRHLFSRTYIRMLSLKKKYYYNHLHIIYNIETRYPVSF